MRRARQHALHPTRAIGLHVAVVGQRTAHRPDLVLRQQQLQLLVAPRGIGGAHEAGQHLALRLQGVGQGDAFGVLGGERLGQARLFGLGGLDRLLCLGDAGIGFAQRGRDSDFSASARFCSSASVATRRFSASSWACASASRAARCGSGAWARMASRQGRRTPAAARAPGHERADDRQAKRTSDSPVIAAGFGRPISCSTVGAMSRSAPPARSVALRPT